MAARFSKGVNISEYVTDISVQYDSRKKNIFSNINTSSSAHKDIKIENWIQVLPCVDTNKHSEALLAIRQQLEYNEPS